MADPTDADTRARARLTQLIYGYRASAVLRAAAALRIADHLHAGVNEAEALAAACGGHAATLRRLLRVLVTLGLIEEAPPGRFTLTAAGEPLRADATDSLRGLALQFSGDTLAVWGDLTHTARTGETTFDHVHGMTSFEFFAHNPAISQGFNERMAAGTRQAVSGILAACDFSRFHTIVDVGGGSGALIAAILQAHPAARGILCDSAAGIEGASTLLGAAGVAARCQAVVVDFFASVPEGGDAYVLKSVIHDWDDARAATILTNCRRVMRSDAWLIVLEPLMPDLVDASEPGRSVVMADLNMLVNTGGLERTESEFARLFTDCGFTLESVAPITAPWPLSVIEASPA